MTYTAQHTCKIKTAFNGPRRVHELDLGTGKSLCARKNDAAASNTFTPDRGSGKVDRPRGAGMTGH